MPAVREKHLEDECRAAAAARGSSFSIDRVKRDRAPDSGWVACIEDPDGEKAYFGTGETPALAMTDLLEKLP
jgi:hypothetical protein